MRVSGYLTDGENVGWKHKGLRTPGMRSQTSTGWVSLGQSPPKSLPGLHRGQILLLMVFGIVFYKLQTLILYWGV